MINTVIDTIINIKNYEYNANVVKYIHILSMQILYFILCDTKMNE